MFNAQATTYLQKYCASVAKAAMVAGVNPSELFSIAPVIETKLRQAIVHADSFLGLVSVFSVDQIKGQVVDIGTGALLTGRVKDGRFRSKLGMDGNVYELVETDSCAAIMWATLTLWANSGSSGEFIKLMNAAVTRNYALDMLRIGFHGTSIAATTDPVANPNGEDVNKGWLAIVKEKASAQVLASAVIDSTGKTADSYKNLDSLVNDLKNTTIHEVHRGNPDLVALIGSDLVASEQHRLLEAADTPTENKAAQSLAKTVAGLKVYTPPFFKPDQIWITSLKNLQILTQKGTQWRKARNEEDRKQFENSYLRMEGYAIGDLDKFAAIQTVTIVDGAVV
ncbi:MAG: phage major capsid protein, P2 family [Aliivibrio sp.]|uniref:phage major capsid protein, P2 family n=1 Tax=Aliivibrio sp. TaxID=1872443 RepID=UPI001A4C44E7|nr:phage major capsid protein, P2 family [Aliivibrio sp.]